MTATPTVHARRWTACAVAGIVAVTTMSASANAVDEPAEPAPPTVPTTAPIPTSVPVATEPTAVVPGPPAGPAPPAAPPADEPSDEHAAETDTVPTIEPAPTTAPAPAQRHVKALPSQIAHILATIRYLESRGNYSEPPNRGRASGAYQFIESTWDGYGGYPHAYLAPPEIQDERAALDVARFLAQWNNDVSMIPVMWYYPRAASDVALMDVVPVPSAGNVLTVREYQQRWLGVWSFLSGKPIPRQLTLGEALARLGIPPALPEQQPVDPPASERTATIAFPVIGPSRLAAPDCGDADSAGDGAGADAGPTPQEIEAAGLCAEEAPGIVFGVKLQPVLSVADGVVTDVNDEPGETISVTVTDDSGRSYTLAGFNDDNPGTDDGAAPPHLRLTTLARVGTGVRAGQILGFMGDSSPLPVGIRSDVPTDATVEIAADSVAPHIRLTIEDLDGTPVDAYGPVIDSLFRQVCSVGTGPWSGPPTGELHDPVTIETTDDNRRIDSEWVITATGEVTAAGWAAMIYPNEGCGWAPELAYGPGAGGSTDVLPSWAEPLDLPTPIWIELARRHDGDRPPAPLLRP